MAFPAFEIDLLVRGRPADVWTRLWDLDRHTEAIPLTTVQGGTLGPGSSFTARTELGPLGFDDTMEVVRWEPPHHAAVVKIGRVLHGAIEVDLRPAGQDTRLRWRQTYGATRVPDTLARYAAPLVRAAYLTSIRRITRS